MGRLQTVEEKLHEQNDSLQLLIHRDEGFITSLVTDLNPGLLKLLLSQAIPRDHAEEILQSTWTTFVETCVRFEGRSKVKTFITGILINKVREWKRGRVRMKPEEDLEAILNETFTKEGWWNKTPPSPLSQLENAGLGMSISGCLEGLTEKQRLAFVLKEVDDEETEEICNLLAVSRTHLGVLIFRAKEKLRICLEKSLAPDRRTA